jgi:hypothetical protein
LLPEETVVVVAPVTLYSLSFGVVTCVYTNGVLAEAPLGVDAIHYCIVVKAPLIAQPSKLVAQAPLPNPMPAQLGLLPATVGPEQ